MKVVLVGRVLDRDRLRSDVAGSGLEIVGEAATLANARQFDFEIDAYLVAPSRALQEERGGDDPQVLGETLTARELDVLALLAEGLPNKAIAVRLAISDQTVKFHVASLIGKLGAANRTEAVRRAVRRGLVVL